MDNQFWEPYHDDWERFLLEVLRIFAGLFDRTLYGSISHVPIDMRLVSRHWTALHFGD